MSSRAIQNLFACYSEQLKNTRQPLKNLKAIDALTHCRTRALGASYYRCKLNHAEIEQLHSCRHRSCYVCTHKQRLEDRKSTRLNSSHVKISYAVFCLKKKTKAKHNEL